LAVLEGLERPAGGVVAGVGADAVAVELVLHGCEDGADHQAYLPLVQVLGRLAQDGGRGVVDVVDGGEVEDEPAQRGAAADKHCDVLGEPGRVGVVQAGAEPVHHQPRHGPRARPDRDGVPVPFRRFHQDAVERVVAVPQVVDDRGDDGEHDAVLDPQDHHCGRGEQGHGELVFPEGQDAPHRLDVDEFDGDHEDHRGQGGVRQVGERPGEQHQDDQDHGGGGQLG